MVYFANKTRNHARGFRIQKHLLAANESCVPITQNCCATDFRKTVIRFVVCQAPHCIPPRKFGVPGAWPLFRRSRGAFPRRACQMLDTPHPPQNGAAQAETAEEFGKPGQTTQLSCASLGPQDPLARKTPFPSPEIYASLISFPLNGKGAFRRPEQGRES